MISSQLEISQRKIFRARRPARTSQTEVRFKIMTNLVSADEEKRLLSQEKHEIVCTGSEKVGVKFLEYSQMEPLKDIIRKNKRVVEMGLKGFLGTCKKEDGRICRFSGECVYWEKGAMVKGVCEIVLEGEENWLVLKNLIGRVLVKEKIVKGFICKEIDGESESILQISKEGEKNIKFSVNQILKHLFLRCFAEAKSRSFFK